MKILILEILEEKKCNELLGNYLAGFGQYSIETAYSICMRMSAQCTGDLCAIIEKILKKLEPMSQWTHIYVQ